MKTFKYEIRGLNLALHCQERPSPEKNSLLFLHGFMDHGLSFRSLMDCFPDKYQCIAVDFRGHGDSDWMPPVSHYNFTDYVVDCSGLIQDIGFEKFSIIGHSLGGAVAMLLACLPEINLSKLILLDSFGPLPYDPKEYPNRYYKAAKQCLAPSRLKQFEDREKMLELAAKKHLSNNPEVARRIAEDNIKVLEEGQFTWKFDPRLKNFTPVRMPESMIEILLKDINCPVRAILSKKGYLFIDIEILKSRQEFISDSKLEWIDAVGHHLHLEEPKDIARSILGYLEE